MNNFEGCVPCVCTSSGRKRVCEEHNIGAQCGADKLWGKLRGGPMALGTGHGDMTIFQGGVCHVGISCQHDMLENVPALYYLTPDIGLYGQYEVS